MRILFVMILLAACSTSTEYESNESYYGSAEGESPDPPDRGEPEGPDLSGCCGQDNGGFNGGIGGDRDGKGGWN